MKKQISIALLVLGAISIGCTDTEEPKKKTIESLNKVEFIEESSSVISSERTGNISTNPTTGATSFEYLTIVQKPYTIKPLSIVTNNNSDVIYPGSILRGDSFMMGKYDPLVLSNDFNLVTLSLDLKGDISVSEMVKPKLSAVRQTINILIAKQKDKVDYSFIPALYDYESNSITTGKSFKKSLKIHANADYMSGLVKASFDYNDSNSSTDDSKYVMVSFRQTLYNASIDTKYYTEWIDGDIDIKDAGDYEPVYVSSVDYGRIGYILIETNKSTEEVKKMITASVNYSAGNVSGSSNLEYKKEFESLFEQSKVKIKINGGPTDLGQQIENFEGFQKFVQMPNAENLTKTSVPIGYKIRRLKDNTEIEVRDTYTESKIEFKDE